MTLKHTPHVQLGLPAPFFELKGVDGQMYTLEDVKGENGLLVMFICNHCPYVKGIMDRLPLDMKALQDAGIGVVAICSNDPKEYVEDSFENMQKFASVHNFSFPYLVDESQKIAQSFGAICTPDFFGYDAQLHLHYRGRLDDAGRGVYIEESHHKELLPAMLELVNTGRITQAQFPSMGCSIKWKNED